MVDIIQIFFTYDLKISVVGQFPRWTIATWPKYLIDLPISIEDCVLLCLLQFMVIITKCVFTYGK